MVIHEQPEMAAQAASATEHHALADNHSTSSEHWNQDVTQQLLDLALGIAAAGHDLKNILTVAYGNIQMVTGEMTVVPRELTAGMQAITSATKLLQELMRRGSKSERPPFSDVPVVVQETLLFSRPLWATIPDLLVTTEAQTMPPAAISAHDLQRALLNLILNAVRAMPNGGKLQVSMAFDNAMVSVKVSDSGSGMDAAILQAVGQPFTKQRAEGLGLGLASCRLLIEQAKGHMDIASVRGSGTSVTLRIPSAVDATILS